MNVCIRQVSRISQIVTRHQPMSGHVTVTYVTTSNGEAARELAKNLVESKLAACVNIIKSVESIYEWKGKIETDNESLLIIKSHSSISEKLTEFIEKKHPYACPEVLTVGVESGSSQYLDWVNKSIKNSHTSEPDKEKEVNKS